MAVEGLLFFSVLAMVQGGVDNVANGTNSTGALQTSVSIAGTGNDVCDDVARSGRGTCPTNWSFVANSDGAPCLQIINTTMSYDAASSFCINLGGNLLTIRSEKRQQAVEEFLPVRFTANAWIGLQRRSYYSPFSWQNVQNSSLIYINTDDSSIIRLYCCGERDCVYLGGSDKKWGAEDCSANMQFICEKQQVCEAGVFGENCDQVCHCYGEACGPDQPCKYGCDQGWMGPYCCTRKRQAEIIYYCVNSATDGRYLLVRINPFGVAYDSLQMLGEDGRAVPWCSGTHISRDSAGIYSIKISVLDEFQEDLGFTCAGSKTGNNSFEWLFSLEEGKGVVLPLDRRVKFSCDFDEADSMVRTQSQEYLRENENQVDLNKFVLPVETPDGSQEDVTLEVTDSFSGKPLSKARLGANVQLQMKLTVSTVSTPLMAKGVSPYKCTASSGDGEHTRELTDDDGCSTFTMSELKGGNATSKSEPFQLFAFPGNDYVVITCSFQLCFLPDDPLCTDRCSTRKVTRTQSRRPFTPSRSPYDGIDVARFKREITTAKTAATVVYVVRDNDIEDDVKSDQKREGEMGTASMGPVAWSLLVLLVCVSAALVLVIAAKKRSHRPYLPQQQQHHVSLLSGGPERSDEQVNL